MFGHLGQSHQLAEGPARQRAGDEKRFGGLSTRADGAAVVIDRKAEADRIELQHTRRRQRFEERLA